MALAEKIADAVFGPSEGDRLEQEAQAGNVVAWWRLKAMVGSQLPAAGSINGRPFDAKALTAEERDALASSLGAKALQEDKGGGLFDSPTRNRIFRLYAAGTGASLDSQSFALLHPAGGDGGEPAIAGIPAKWILAAGVGWIVLSLLRR